jgi:hypothetical protein
MKHNPWLAVRMAVLATVASASALCAQARPLTVTGVRGVTFGVVFPGVPRVVLRTDPANSGQFGVAGPKNATLQLSFTLPGSMNGPAGATMPLFFGGGDAGYSAPETITSQIGFDPKQPFTTALDKNGKAIVFLGATAQPTTAQRAGAYTATITLTVALLP